MKIEYYCNIHQIGENLYFNRSSEEGEAVGSVHLGYFKSELIRVKPVDESFMINATDRVIGLGETPFGTHAVVMDVTAGCYSLVRKTKGGWVKARDTHRYY